MATVYSNIDNRLITVGDAGTNPRRKKQPADIFRYRVDYTTWCSSVDTIISFTTSVTTLSGTTPPTIASAAIEGTKIVALNVVGGATGWVGTIAVIATIRDADLSLNQIKKAEFTLEIQAVE